MKQMISVSRMRICGSSVWSFGVWIEDAGHDIRFSFKLHKAGV